jgi:hypothetical protein
MCLQNTECRKEQMLEGRAKHGYKISANAGESGWLGGWLGEDMMDAWDLEKGHAQQKARNAGVTAS